MNWPPTWKPCCAFANCPPPDDLRGEVVEILRQLENWQAVDGGLAPDRAERDGLRRRVERDYALARSLRVFLPHWDEVQRALRRRYISLSANYFAQAIAALDTLLDELRYEDTDPLRSHSAWQSLRQAMHGINTETRDFARELRSLRVDGNHPEALADIADRLGILHEKFFRVAAEGAAQVRERLDVLRDDRHAGENVRRLQETLRLREEEWSVGLGETQAELHERLDAVGQDVVRELSLFERFMADSGPGSWREGAKIISLALVELTERIHAAISLRLQQTQAMAALLRRARTWPRGGGDATQRARQYLWNASGSLHAALWVQAAPASDQQVRLERWLMQKGGSPLPLVDEDIWERSLRPRHRPAPPPPPQPLLVTEDWDPAKTRACASRGGARAAGGAADHRWLGAGARTIALVRGATAAGVVPLAATRERAAAAVGAAHPASQARGCRAVRRCRGRASRWSWTITASAPPPRPARPPPSSAAHRQRAQQAPQPTPASVGDGAERVDAPLRPALAAQAAIVPAAATHPLEDMDGLEPESAYATRESGEPSRPPRRAPLAHSSSRDPAGARPDHWPPAPLAAARSAGPTNGDGAPATEPISPSARAGRGRGEGAIPPRVQE